MCEECENGLRKDYNEAMNNNLFFSSYEHYEDINLEDQINQIAVYSRCNNEKNKLHSKVLDKSRLIFRDLISSLYEKTYIKSFKNAVDTQEFLQKQGCQIREVQISENKIKDLIIKFPQDRKAILIVEMEAIRIIARERQQNINVDFDRHEIILGSDLNEY